MTSPGLISFDRIALTVASWLSKTRAGPVNFRIDFVDAGGLHDAAVERDVALQHGKPAILGEGAFGRADGARLAVEVELGPAVRLREGLRGAHAAGSGHEEVAHRVGIGAADVPLVERVAHGQRVHGRLLAVDQAGAVELAEDGHDAAGAVDVFHVHVGLGRRDLAQHRNLARQRVDVVHGEVDAALVCCGKDVQHGVCRAAHGDVERHGVLEGRLGGDGARQRGLVVLLVIAAGEIDDGVAGLDEQALAVGMGGERRAVAGQGQAERLGQAVHRIGGEHARARAAGRARRFLDGCDLLVGIAVVGGHHHGVDEVERLQLALDASPCRPPSARRRRRRPGC